MKRTTTGLIMLMVLLTGAMFAQGTRDIFIWEDFGSGTFPPAGWTISANAANWTAFGGANAGGSAPELRLSWTPQFQGTSYFISPAIDTSGQTNLFLDFRQFVDHYQSPFTIGVATRSAGGTWNTAWSMNPAGNVGPELKTIQISNADVGAVDFQFALYFSGSSYNIDYWYIDNIKLYTPFPYDLAIMDSDLPDHIDAGSTLNPACTVKNAGLNALTATVSLNIFRGNNLEATYPDYYSAYLDPGATQTATAPAFTPTLSNELYTFIFSVTSLEDVVDDDLSNNTWQSHVNTWTGAKQMVVLEIGTGGWCPYCPGAAMAADDFIDDGYPVAVIENHNGDPYANDTSNARNTYYGISGYPTGIFDGVLSYVGGNNTTSIINSYMPLYQQRSEVKTPLNIMIYGEETRENYDITIRLDKFAPIGDPNLVLHLAITESDIAYNWQGQNHFNFVNRMMYPTWEGTPIDLVNAPNGFNDFMLSIAKDLTWITTNCELVAFIQNLDTKEIIQANKIMLYDLVAPPVANDDPGTPGIATALYGNHPNPFNPLTTIRYSLKEAMPVRVDIFNVKGQLVKTLVNETKAAGEHNIEWNGTDNAGLQVSSGIYYFKMSAGKYSSTRKMVLMK
jgi:hypothetical protein